MSGVYCTKQQRRIYAELKNRSPELGLLWLLGCATGYRVSDLLALRVSDTVTDTISVTEIKTGKPRIMVLPPHITRAIKRYVSARPISEADYLFAARSRAKPITRQHAHGAIKSVGNAIGLTNLGTHSMRKTYAYNLLRRSRSVAIVQDALNHAYKSTTYDYVADGLLSHLPKPTKACTPIATKQNPA